MPHNHHPLLHWVFAGFLFVILLAGCGPAATATEVLPVETRVQMSQPPATLVPTATRTSTAVPASTSTTVPGPTLQPPVLDAGNYERIQPGVAGGVDLGGLILSADVNRDGDFLAVSRDGDILILDLQTAKIVQTLTPGALTNALKFSPDDPQLLASGSNDGFVRLWNWEEGTAIGEFSAHPKGINQIAFQPGGRLLVSAGNDALVQLWDSDTGENLGYLIGGAFAVPDLAFLPGGDQLLTVDGGVIRVREVEGGRLVTSIRVGDSVPVIVPDHSGTRVVASLKPAILQIWGLEESVLLGELQLDGLRDVWAMTLNPAGDLLAVGGRDGSVCFVPLEGFGESACQRVSKQPISALVFLPDGRRLISGGYDGVLNFWQVYP